MAIRNVLKVGDTALRTVCRDVTEFDDRLGQLLDDLTETMFYHKGAGLAAPQVGVLKNVFVVCVDEKNVFEFVNAKIVRQSGTLTANEGCLSIPNFNAQLARPKRVTVRAFDRFGNPFELKAIDFFARAVCHESDHIKGILFTDKVEKSS